MSTNESQLLQEQQAIAQTADRAIDAWLAANNQAKHVLEAAQRSSETAKDAELARIEQLHLEGLGIFGEANAFLKEKDASLIRSTPPAAGANGGYTDLRQCVSAMKDALGTLKAANPSPTGCFWSIVVILGLVLAVSSLSALGTDFGAFLFMLAIDAGVAWIAILYGRAHPGYAPAYGRLVEIASNGEYWYAQSQKSAYDAHGQRIAAAKQARDQQMQRATDELSQSLVALEPRCAAQHLGAIAAVPPWDAPSWDEWQPATASGPRLACLGEFVVGPQGQRLRFPALVPFPDGRALVFESTGQGIDTAMLAIQSLLVRLLATIPPGKVYFAFIDPVSLGQRVAPFMHLAAHDKELVGEQQWTEPREIEEQLMRLKTHIGYVNRKYLQNPQDTIREHNERADEIAEAYRVLVVLDFPAKFSQEAIGNLLSIAQAGPRCGVFTIILRDSAQQPLYQSPVDLSELYRTAYVVSERGEQFRMHDGSPDDDYGYCDLELDQPPTLTLQSARDETLFGRIVREVGKGSLSSREVKVSFERVFALFEDHLFQHTEKYPGFPLDCLPAPANVQTWWGANTRHYLVGLLGREGAAGVQVLKLGKDDAVHALITGQTGSGKTTLLHTLITSLAITYSPEELQLYLIDLKQGVGFKPYAVMGLPHARVVAIESERTFALSVLEDLAKEIEERGDLLKAVGVDDLYKYPASGSSRPPRILLMIDEYQELFVEDDTIALRAQPILERIARQGRALGLHLILSSQTLSGASALATGILGQIQVRIALRSGTAGMGHGLAEDNDAASLLSRQGEAVHNASHGLKSANVRFQVAYVPDEERDAYLASLSRFAQQRGYTQRPIVFNGSSLADAGASDAIRALLAATATTGSPRAVLGDPIALRGEVAAYFRRQSGSNLLIVGQREEAARGLFATAILGLLAQLPRRTLAPGYEGQRTFAVLDFSATDGPNADFFERLVGTLPAVAHFGRRRQVTDIIGALATEVQRRIDADEANAPPLYLFLYGLHRARDLRQDDNLGYSPSYSAYGDEPPAPNPAQQFVTLVREGPDVGIHTIAWCDTVTNLNRTLERRALREFSMHVAFRMSAEDSNNLIDTPDASRLREHRALFHDEDSGRQEEFRPYATPSEGWLHDTLDQLAVQR